MVPSIYQCHRIESSLNVMTAHKTHKMLKMEYYPVPCGHLAALDTSGFSSLS